MQSLNRRISNLRKISIFLFLTPTVALILSILIHNSLVSFHFSSKQPDVGELPFLINCNKENNYCSNLKKTTKFDECNKNILDSYFLVEHDKTRYLILEDLFKNKYDKNKLSELNIKKIYDKSEILNKSCILNSNLYSVYKIFPNLFYFIEKIKNSKKYRPGTSVAVNPFIYGETSISNIAKRYPVNIIFKPFLYLSSILMIFYWIGYTKIFREILKDSKLYKFTIFGLASSVFLFIHVLLLGSEIENEIFHKYRKLNLILFILCEIIAQFFLTRKLYMNYKNLSNFIFNSILNLKIIFVSIIIISSVIIIGILAFYDLDSKVDYLLEWNYFLFLLFFYFLSALMWKK